MPTKSVKKRVVKSQSLFKKKAKKASRPIKPKRKTERV